MNAQIKPTRYTLLHVVSWEPRSLGAVKDIVQQRYHVDSILTLYAEEFDERSKLNREAISELAVQTNSVYNQPIAFSLFQPERTWRALRLGIRNIVSDGNYVIVDISTMPREIIWFTFSILREIGCDITYVYYCPKEYPTTWLSRHPLEPRLVLKHSGIQQLGAKTILGVMPGYDIQRTWQFIRKYEPSKVIVFEQPECYFKHAEQGVEAHRKWFEECGVETEIKSGVDAYSDDQGEAKMLQCIDNDRQSNWILVSLGPKPSAAAMYRLFLSHSDIALAYAPCREYNPEYSVGIDLERVIIGSLST